MFIRIDTNHKLPIYRQIADEIKMLIVKGELVPGAMLPSVRQLATDTGVNLNTVAIAYRELQEEGLISIRHGSGAVVTSRTSQSQSIQDLRRSLRVALTGLVLAGLSRKEIKKICGEELQQTLQG
ncbi:MAG TPA: GntR family transcriptional regulator [Blastocatellia bacterium]|nr:GntR family transcriptional regulator [Blastocatellia bacterium]